MREDGTQLQVKPLLVGVRARPHLGGAAATSEAGGLAGGVPRYQMTAFTAPAGRAAAGTSLAPAAPSSLGIAGRRPTPLVRATAQLCMTYRRSAPDALTGAGYRVGAAPPPRRYLTEDAQPAHANGYDNANHDLIVAVHDELVPKVGAPYRVRSLGSGTFGQAFLCAHDARRPIRGNGGGGAAIEGGVGSREQCGRVLSTRRRRRRWR